jgi:hypothetical protein
MAWPFVLVLDLNQNTARCRACGWKCSPAASVTEARQACARHRCTGRPVRSPLLGWCAVCGQVRLGGLRPAGPVRPRAWVRTWVCEDWVGCVRRSPC